MKLKIEATARIGKDKDNNYYEISGFGYDFIQKLSDTLYNDSKIIKLESTKGPKTTYYGSIDDTTTKVTALEHGLTRTKIVELTAILKGINDTQFSQVKEAINEIKNQYNHNQVNLTYKKQNMIGLYRKSLP